MSELRACVSRHLEFHHDQGPLHKHHLNNRVWLGKY
ncbi:hypothetical protein X975_25026, partial [Stegodyphus mimosarum]